MSRARTALGLTVIELLISLVILGVLLALTIPSFNEAFQKNRLKGAGERLAAETQFARGEALSRRTPVTVVVNSGSEWCLGVNQGNTGCDCSISDSGDADACVLDGVLRVAAFDDFQGVEIQGANRSVTFEPVRGIPTSAVDDWPVLFRSVRDQEVGVRLTALGSVHMCSPEGSGNIWDYPQC